MTKKRRFWFPAAYCLTALIPFLLGTCLNPINFDADDLPALKVRIDGGNVNVSITDVAVFWLINRTKDIDVSSLTIDRPKGKNEKDNQYVYPKHYAGRPKSGKSLASYHNPSDEYSYTVSAVWENNTSHNTGIIDSGEIQFPRAQDYKYYLYWDQNGKLQLVDETKMQSLPPDPNRNWPDPGPVSDKAYTMVVFNVTKDQNIDAVEFTKGNYAYSIANEPRAKDQEMIKLGAGSYDATVFYTRKGVPITLGPKNAIITAEQGSMAVRTNFMYFYKTIGGDYGLSQTWPPIPNDASDENSLEDTLPEGTGILRIVNKAIANQPNAIITRIKIDNEEKPNGTNTVPYMVPGDIKNYMLNAGTVNVAFRAMNQNMYGITIPREIYSRQITTLEYIGEFANPDFIPPDAGYGSGLIRVINQSSGLVSGATVFDLNALSKSVIYGYEDFNPPQMINNGQTGRISVIGTAEFPLAGGTQQLIQVYLDTVDKEPVTIQRIASINGTIVDIVITQNDLEKNKRIGSKVTVKNQTAAPTLIKAIQVYNKGNPGVSAVYNLNVSNSSVPPQEDVYVLSGTGFPIMPGDSYAANLTVYAGNGNSAIIHKEFTPAATLYSAAPDSSIRYITLLEGDLPQELILKPITSITIPPSALTATTTYTTNANSITVKGKLDFNAVPLTFSPADASKKSPVTWTSTGGVVSIANNVLAVEQISPSSGLGLNGTGSASVTVKATIPGGGPGGGDYSQSFNVTLPYADTTPPSSKPVTSITLASPSPIEAGQGLSLPPLVTFNPAGAHVNGTPVTTDNITWTIIGGAGAGISGGTFTAAAAGSYTVQAALPGAYTATGAAITAVTTVTVVPPPTPASLTLRIILVNKKDSVKQIALVPANRANSSNALGSVYSNGYTGEQWAANLSYDPTYTTANRFAKRWPDAIYKTVDLPKGEGNYRDVTIDWPASGGYYLFFLEGDNRARGYCYPGNKTAPGKDENYLFYLHAGALTPIWLNSQHIETAPGTAGAVPVIPISYHTDNNVASIMKSNNIGSQPKYTVTF